MGIENIELLFPWDVPNGWSSTPPIPPHPPVNPFTVNAPDSNGIFTITGDDDAVYTLDDLEFELSSTYVTDNGDGSYTATSQ